MIDLKSFVRENMPSQAEIDRHGPSSFTKLAADARTHRDLITAKADFGQMTAAMSVLSGIAPTRAPTSVSR